MRYSIPDKNLENDVKNHVHSKCQNQNAGEPKRGNDHIPTKTPYENTVKSEHSKLYIKNMVSIRCKMIVKSVLENLGLNYSAVELGEVELIGNLSSAMHDKLKSELLNFGFELIEDNNYILVEKIKIVVLNLIHYSDEQPNINFSDYLSHKLNHDYTYLSNLFTRAKGMSIQHFMLLHKIERIKELLM